MGIAIILFIIILIMILVIYNNLIRARNRVKQAKSGIDVYLNQRFDLIPNLVECVKQYSEYEKGVFAEITELRVSYLKDSTNLKSAEKINNKMNEIVALAENYPELKSSEQYLNLQRNLTKLESQLQAARRIYNMEVTSYNNKIETVPSNIVAKLFGFKKAELFQIEEYKRENVMINNEDK